MADEIRFPAGFAWGTARSSHQAEGGNVHNDWRSARSRGTMRYASARRPPTLI